jgi:hypothetical protein
MGCLAGGTLMEKFRIPTIPKTTSKSIRFPDNIIEDVEKAIAGKDCTFTAFVVEAVRVALVNLPEEDEIDCK